MCVLDGDRKILLTYRICSVDSVTECAPVFWGRQDGVLAETTHGLRW